MAKEPPSSLGSASLKILDLLRQHPNGLDIKELRSLGDFGSDQQHLDRRLRDLDPHFILERTRRGTSTVYTYKGERPEGEWMHEKISKTLRAKILTRDGRRCRMCGKTVDQDAIKLHVDHKIPENWGGTTDEDNLWSLCSVCNEGKKNYFASFDSDLMEGILKHPSVHRRIAELLRLQLGQWVDSDLLEFVANFEDYQTDWRKRLRELRYLGLEIESSREKRGKRTVSQYRIKEWVELPDDPSQAARKYELLRAARNKEPRIAD